MSYEKVLRKDGTPEPYLFLHKDTGTYYVRKAKAGRGRLFKSTRATSIADAKRVRDQLIAEFEGHHSSGARKRVRFVCDSLMKELEAEFKSGQRRKRTYDHDKTYLPLIAQFFGDHFADELDEQVWKNWVRANRGKRKVFDVAKYLSKVMSHAFAIKAAQRKPVFRVPKETAHAVEIYSDEDVKLFLGHARGDLRDLIILAAECGMRPHENREIRWRWISFRDGVAVISLPAEFTKTARGRTFEAGPNASQMLARRHANPRRGEFVFPAPRDPRRPISDVQLSKLWRRMLVSAKITRKIKFHWLRHTFYTKALLDAQVPVQLVSEYGGTSIVTLQKHYLRGDARRTSAVARAVQLDLGG